MSKKIFSAPDWENAPSKNMPKTGYIPDRHPYTTSEDVQEKVETVIGEIEARNLDIAPTYSDWVNLGFGLVDEYGENGRAYFHRLSKLHSDYDYHVADKQYTKCLNSKGCGITLSTFFYLASKAGILLFNHKKTILPNIQNGEKDKWKIDSTDLPVLPESLYSSLPPFILEVVNSSISVED